MKVVITMLARFIFWFFHLVESHGETEISWRGAYEQHDTKWGPFHAGLRDHGYVWGVFVAMPMLHLGVDEDSQTFIVRR